MAKLNLKLDTVSEESGSKYSKVPAGIYSTTITAVAVKETSAKNGHYLEVELQILDGEHTGKKIADRVNIDNPTPKALEIGLARLKKIAIVCGHKNPNFIEDTDELLTGNVFSVETELKMNKGSDGKEFEAVEVKKYMERTEGETAVSAPTTKETAKAASSKKPWEK